jgi:hypothetical protein
MEGDNLEKYFVIKKDPESKTPIGNRIRQLIEKEIFSGVFISVASVNRIIDQAEAELAERIEVENTKLANRAVKKAITGIMDAIGEIGSSYWLERTEGTFFDMKKKIAELEAQCKEFEEAKEVIAWANNSLYGSHGYFLSKSSGPPDPHHLDRPIEDLKKRYRKDYYKVAEIAKIVLRSDS